MFSSCISRTNHHCTIQLLYGAVRPIIDPKLRRKEGEFFLDGRIWESQYLSPPRLGSPRHTFKWPANRFFIEQAVSPKEIAARHDLSASFDACLRTFVQQPNNVYGRIPRV